MGAGTEEGVGTRDEPKKIMENNLVLTKSVDPRFKRRSTASLRSGRPLSLSGRAFRSATGNITDKNRFPDSRENGTTAVGRGNHACQTNHLPPNHFLDTWVVTAARGSGNPGNLLADSSQGPKSTTRRVSLDLDTHLWWGDAVGIDRPDCDLAQLGQGAQ